MEQTIDEDANEKLIKYLQDFQTVRIKKPYGARKIKLLELKTQQNKNYIYNLYLQYFNNDFRISYTELYSIGFNSGNKHRYEK